MLLGGFWLKNVRADALLAGCWLAGRAGCLRAGWADSWLTVRVGQGKVRDFFQRCALPKSRPFGRGWGGLICQSIDNFQMWGWFLKKNMG